MTKPILILNGPNLNMLGFRQPEIYGTESLKDIEAAAMVRARALGLVIDFRQSNHEGVLVDWIQEARGSHVGIIINGGAYTHTSVAILDALLAAELPVIEVHLSHLLQREEFRHHSFIAKAAKGMICGFGSFGYPMALEAMARLLGRDS